MVITRISTYNTVNNTINDAIGTQARLFDLQKQISSGFKTDNYKGLFGEIEGFTALQNRMDQTGQFLVNNQILSAQVNAREKALGDVIDTANDLQQLIILRRNNTANEDLRFPTQLSELWSTIGSSLNVNLEGRYLFGGIRTDIPPVDSDTFPALFGDGSTLEANYYRGATRNTTMKVETDRILEVTTRADDVAIQQIYTGIALALEGHNANDDAQLSQAYDLISAGLEGVSSMRSDIGIIQQSLDQASTRQNQQLLYWRGLRDTMISTDLVAASTQVAQDQGILQASFQAFARINSLKLSDYI